MGVKASGGVRTRDDAQKMKAAGASRIGASASGVDRPKGCATRSSEENPSIRAVRGCVVKMRPSTPSPAPGKPSAWRAATRQRRIQEDGSGRTKDMNVVQSAPLSAWF